MTWLVVALLVAPSIVLSALLVRERGRRAWAGPGHEIADEPRAPAADPVAVGIPWKDVLDALPIGVIAVDSEGREVGRNAVIDSLVTARHGRVLVEAACERLSARGRRGQTGVETVELIGPPLQVLEIRSHLVDAGTMLTVADTTERSRLDQARTDLVANISHELKTPVGAMSVLAESLAGGSEDELVARLARRIVDEAHRMSRTIEGLLELSRIEMDGGSTGTVVDVARVAEEAAERARPLADRQGVAISVVTEAGLTVRGDHEQLLSAIGNLVDNAVQYTPGEGEVTVVTARRGESVVVEVGDRGIGIPASELERIFQRFYRVDRARSRATGGTGLGLSIVRHVATNHGAEVEVTSREGEGSTFRLVLPREAR